MEEEKKTYTTLQMGANQTHFNVQRIFDNRISQKNETFIPDSTIKDLLSFTPPVMPAKFKQALDQIKKIMETEI